MPSTKDAWHRLKWLTARVAASLLAISLSSCSLLRPEFSEMSATYGEVVEKYQVNNILVNIVRASQQRPLSFLDIPTVIGSGSVTVSAALLSKGLADGGLAAGLSTGNSFSFTQASLDNSSFMSGFLSQIPVEAVHYFSADHIPKEILLTLVVDSIEIIDTKGRKEIFLNNPTLPNYAEFQKHLYHLIRWDITTEQIEEEVAIGIPMRREEIEKSITHNLAAVKNLKLRAKKVSILDQNLYQLTQVKKVTRLCINKDRFSNYQLPGVSGEALFCKGSLAKHIETDSSRLPAIKPQDNQKELVIRLRSTRNIFDVLGQLLRVQTQEPPYYVSVPPISKFSELNTSQPNPYSLLIIQKNSTTPQPLYQATADGERYSIPKTHAGYSGIVIDLLSQFITLNKIPGSIPTSPSVLVR